MFYDPLRRLDIEGDEHGETRWRTTGEIDGILCIVSQTIREEGEEESTAPSRREEPHLVTVRFSRRKPPKLTPEQKKRLDALAAMPDDQIDFSDIPELTNEQLRNRTVYIGLVPGPGRKRSVTIRLDEDMVKWFKKQGKGWQTKMNWVLRLYFASHRKTGVKVGRP